MILTTLAIALAPRAQDMSPIGPWTWSWPCVTCEGTNEHISVPANELDAPLDAAWDSHTKRVLLSVRHDQSRWIVALNSKGKETNHWIMPLNTVQASGPYRIGGQL